MKELTHERLKELLHYDADTGTFTWLAYRNGTRGAGSAAGSLNKRGYVTMWVDRRGYQGHILAWFYAYGTWPSHQIDHINGRKDDNRLLNLREATSGENQLNKGVRSDSKSEVKGVGWNARSGKWRVHVQAGGKRYHFGWHTDLEFAELVASEARIKLHGEFSRDR